RAFAAAGVEIVDLPPISGLRPSAPVRIAVDALELMDHATRIDEFVFLTGDADLSAVLQRLRAQGHSTALLCESGAAAAVEGLVDRVIKPEDFVRRAFEGKPAVRSLIETVERALNPNYVSSFNNEDEDGLDVTAPDAPPADELPALEDSPTYELLPRVARRVVQAIEQKAAPMESIDLLPIFREFPEFTMVRSDQQGAWFGAGGLSNLVRRLAALEPRLKLDVRGARATRAGRLVDRIFVDLAPAPKPAAKRRGAAAPIEDKSVVDRALEVIKDEVSRSQTPLHMAYLRLQVLEELGAAAAAAGLADVGGKGLKDAALRYGLSPFALVEPRAGYVLVMDPARHQMPE
ncbi:MAG: NYN domain-containing protein, partial [Caulobacterales bacterium]